MVKKRALVVDGANVAYEGRSKDGKPKLANVLAMHEELERRGFQPIVMADAALYHAIDDRAQFGALVERQVIHQAPAQTEADDFNLQLNEECDARVVTNDRFEPYQDEHHWIRDRRMPFMIVDATIELYEPELDGKS
jgi:hypothetical protein